MTRLIAFLAILGLTSLTCAQAEIFMHRDAAGNVIFSDQRQSADSVQIELTPINETALPQPPAPTPSKPKAAPPFSYTRLSVIQPEADATIRDNQGILDILISSEPGLRRGDLYQLLLDSQPMGAPQADTAFHLVNIDRGTHLVAFRILDPKGQTVAESAAIPVHLKRMSLAERRRANPCKRADYGVRPECPIEEKPEEESRFRILPFL